jgi:hypothetical protein
MAEETAREAARRYFDRQEQVSCQKVGENQISRV